LACHAIWQLECRAWDMSRRPGDASAPVPGSGPAG
jgi:hypothetical protein